MNIEQQVSPTYLEEFYFLARLVVHPAELAECLPLIKPEHLTDERHQTLYRLLIEGHAEIKKGTPAALWSLIVASKKSTLLTADYLTQLFDKVQDSKAVITAERLARLAKIRALSNLVNRLSKELPLIEDLSESQLNAYYANLTSVMASIGTRGKPVSGYEAAAEFQLEAPRRGAEAGEPTTGFTAIDSAINFFKRGALVVIGALPKIGKSSIMRQMIGNNPSAEQLVITLEAPVSEFRDKFICGLAHVKYRDWEQRALTDSHRSFLLQAQGYTAEMRLTLCDFESTAAGIAMLARRQEAIGKKPRIIWVDHFHHMSHPKEKFEQDRIAMGRSAEILANLAKELDCTVVILAQFNREPAKREPPRPEAYDLSETGRIEQLAFHVMNLWAENIGVQYRWAYFPITREAGRFEVMLGWTPELTRFRDVTQLEEAALVSSNQHAR